jgi:hypothetical protein
MAPIWIKIVPSTAAVLAAVIWWGHREPAAAPKEHVPPVVVHKEAPPPSLDVHRDEELRREVQTLKGKLDQISEVRSAPVLAPPARTPTFDFEGAREAEKQMLITLNETLERESVDPKWSAEMDERVKGFIAAAGRGTSLLGMDCRTTMCRANVRLDDGDAKASFTRRVSDLLPKGAEGYAYMDSPDDLTLEVFLSREGHRLPAN